MENPMNEKLSREEVALRCLEVELNNTFTWAGKTREQIVAYCFKVADEFIRQRDGENNE